MSYRITTATVGALGHTTYGGLKQIAVRIPETMWNELKARAIKENCSMHKKLVDYIECGLEVDRDWDESETKFTDAELNAEKSNATSAKSSS